MPLETTHIMSIHSHFRICVAPILKMTAIMRPPLYWFFAFVALFLLLEVHSTSVKGTSTNDATELLLSVLVLSMPTLYR